MGIRIDDVHKSFGSFKALDGVSLAIESGELVALLGPSGSGKTSLLRIVAGLETADRGEIYLDRKEASGRPVKSRNVGFVFQHYALFRHMTVFDNIAFGLRVKNRGSRPGKEEIRDKVMKLLDMIHLSGMQDRYPSQLSGGQRQRVALARTLAVDPKMLLLDEPFGALDAKVRKDLRRWLRRLHDDLGITTVFVTHDQEEAMELSDRVVVMNAGKIEQIGTPGEVYHSPANAFVYDFLGNYNAFEGWRRSSGELHLLKPDQSPPDGVENLLLFARPHDMDVAMSPQGEDSLLATVIHINPAGALISIEMEDKDGRLLQAALTKEKFASLQLQRGEIVYLKPSEMRIFPDRRQESRQKPEA